MTPKYPKGTEVWYCEYRHGKPVLHSFITEDMAICNEEIDKEIYYYEYPLEKFFQLTKNYPLPENALFLCRSDAIHKAADDFSCAYALCLGNKD